ncbi:hypothetical protein BST97_15120 [Nonlabens spongiae]|uniref:CopG family transcriptional regulator n=1 Tax=Nonlabens spongiae TaxID=331648 RepID=A0A1W6MNX3_9FLAO|nr:hypothetical protein [Nonlabens spongiae]ARN79206.1 hypothetical protein BST97_15120 [Nonlabens spongiae]
MKISKIRKKLRDYVEIGDEEFLNVLMETASVYIEQKKLDQSIAEGEQDIAKGNLHSQSEVQKMIEAWTEN